jgi:hypothetical protein
MRLVVARPELVLTIAYVIRQGEAGDDADPDYPLRRLSYLSANGILMPDSWPQPQCHVTETTRLEAGLAALTDPPKQRDGSLDGARTAQADNPCRPA